MQVKDWKDEYWCKQVSASSLGIFRIFFGIILFVLVSRFFLYGLIDKYFIQPKFFFHYFGFGFLSPLPGMGMYILFSILLILSLLILFGIYFRTSLLFFFIGFTYFHLLDKTFYLNHYYLVSLLCFLLLFTNADSSFSWKTRGKLTNSQIPIWQIQILRFQLSVVYFFGAIAKVKSDWLLEAQPLKIWLIRNADLPYLGHLLQYPITAYFFSYAGFLFDLCIPFLLWRAKSRKIAYVFVLLFHILTWILFPIGMFPWIMIFSTTLFFAPDWPQRLLKNFTKTQYDENSHSRRCSPILAIILGLYVLWQTLWPLRNLLYPGPVSWTEEGFRFAWQIMIIQKNGWLRYKVVNPSTGQEWQENPEEYLLPNQYYMMSSQPDMILEFAHHLKSLYTAKGFPQVQVYAESFASLNGKPAKRLIDPKIDLASQQDSWKPKNWILR